MLFNMSENLFDYTVKLQVWVSVALNATEML